MHFMPRVIDARSLEFLISVGMQWLEGKAMFGVLDIDAQLTT